MSGPQHAVPAIDAVVDYEEVIVLGELVFVYAVHASLGRCTAQTVAGCYQTSVLQSVSGVSQPVRCVDSMVCASYDTYTLECLLLLGSRLGICSG